MRACEFVTEKWTQKYKKSINCASPKGFSQKAHCAGRKKNEAVAEGLDIGQEWMSDTELDQYVPERLQRQWRELLGYDENGNPSVLWANLTGGYEPDVRDPQDRALMVKVANKWFAAKKIPNVKFFNVKDADDELEWLVQIGEQDVAEGARVARKPGQPAGSKKHSDLYTDENPKGTITGLKFATAEDARASVSKIRNSGRSHAHKIQAAVAMEQRARAAGKSEAAAVYRKYINANKKTESLEDQIEAVTEDLRKWFKQKWVRFGPDGKIRGPCARGSEKEGKPKCLPQAKAHALGKKGRATAGARKRREDPNPERRGKAINVRTK